MSERGSIGRQYDGALTRVRAAFKAGRLPRNVGDLALAAQSEHVTVSESEYIEALIGDHEDMHPS